MHATFSMPEELCQVSPKSHYGVLASHSDPSPYCSVQLSLTPCFSPEGGGSQALKKIHHPKTIISNTKEIKDISYCFYQMKLCQMTIIFFLGNLIRISILPLLVTVCIVDISSKVATEVSIRTC